MITWEHATIVHVLTVYWMLFPSYHDTLHCLAYCFLHAMIHCLARCFLHTMIHCLAYCFLHTIIHCIVLHTVFFMPWYIALLCSYIYIEDIMEFGSVGSPSSYSYHQNIIHLAIRLGVTLSCEYACMMPKDKRRISYAVVDSIVVAICAIY